MIQKRKIIPRLDKTIRYLEKKKRECVTTANMAYVGGCYDTSVFFHGAWYGFQDRIRELTRKKAYLKPQCDNPIEEFEDYFGEFATGDEL